MIEWLDAVTIEEAREISEGLDTDQDRASLARKRRHTDDFLYDDDWKGEVRIPLSISQALSPFVGKSWCNYDLF